MQTSCRKLICHGLNFVVELVDLWKNPDLQSVRAIPLGSMPGSSSRLLSFHSIEGLSILEWKAKKRQHAASELKTKSGVFELKWQAWRIAHSWRFLWSFAFFLWLESPAFGWFFLFVRPLLSFQHPPAPPHRGPTGVLTPPHVGSHTPISGHFWGIRRMRGGAKIAPMLVLSLILNNFRI